MPPRTQKPTTTEVTKPKRNLSPEARERLRQAAKKRYEEGKFGGSKFGKMGGRGNKRDRAANKVSDSARKNAEKIIRVFEDGIKDTNPMSIRLKSAELWLQVEREEGKLALQEEQADAQQMSRDELISALTRGLTSGPVADMLKAKMLEQEAGIVDAEVVDDGVQAA